MQTLDASHIAETIHPHHASNVSATGTLSETDSDGHSTVTTTDNNDKQQAQPQHPCCHDTTKKHGIDDEVERQQKQQDKIPSLASADTDLEQGQVVVHGEPNDVVSTTAKHTLEDSQEVHSSSDSTDDEDHSDHVQLPDSFDFDDEDCGLIMIPKPGQPLYKQGESQQQELKLVGANPEFRSYSNGCPICLSPFGVNDQVSWSHNPSCSHVFHTACIHEWLAAAGRKHMKRQQQRLRLTNHQTQPRGLVLRHDPITTILSMPLLCPCCRAPFLLNDDEANHKKARSRPSSERTIHAANRFPLVTDPLSHSEPMQQTSPGSSVSSSSESSSSMEENSSSLQVPHGNDSDEGTHEQPRNEQNQANAHRSLPVSSEVMVIPV